MPTASEAIRITILDYDLDRINACEKSLYQALRELGLKGVVVHISEPPYLARLQVWERMPALEIDGLIWSRASTEAFKKDEVITLLGNICGKDIKR